MLCLTLMVFLLRDVLRSVVAVNCPGLPTISTDIQPALKTLVANGAGEDPASVTVTIESGPFFTCQVQGTAVGTFQKVSLIMIYDSSEGHNDAVGQFEMECIDFGGNNRLWDRVSNSLSTPGVDYTTISLWTNCSDCVTSSPSNENHCQSCHSACNTGLMRCTGTGSGDCCVAFDNGMCSNDLTCTETNFVANEQNNYTCACGVCDPGYMLNSSLCSCILNDTCVANTPCANNSTCVLGSSPDKYTCDCTGTNFMGANCLEPEPLSSPLPSPTSQVCSANCTKCDSMGCCSQCLSGFNRDGCGCVSAPPIVCNIRRCDSCSSSYCCSHCHEGYSNDRDDPCTCVTATTSSTSFSATPTQTVKRRQSGSSSILAVIVSSVVGAVLLILKAVVITASLVLYFGKKKQKKNSVESTEMKKDPRAI